MVSLSVVVVGASLLVSARQDHGIQGFLSQLGLLILVWTCPQDTAVGC